ncbi:MAG: hypothetical protein P4L69_21215 [Desulfosporosinus sp.]|nr:hypothetical protein [Desulfosporosinus sp.]
MSIFPAFISPIESLVIFLPVVAIPMVIIVLVVWFVKKINSINANIIEIRKLLETQKHNHQ